MKNQKIILNKYNCSGHPANLKDTKAALQKRSWEKVFLKICSKFMREHPCWSVISIKLFCNFTKITFQHGCSPVNLQHIFRTHFPNSYSGGMFLKIQTRYVVKLKIIQSLSACRNHSINLLDSSNDFWDTPDFIVPWSKRSTLFLSMNNNLYQHAKN